jgi:hypothetical protein
MTTARTQRNRMSKRQRIECFKKALPLFLKDAQDYEKSKTFPNNFKRIK